MVKFNAGCYDKIISKFALSYNSYNSKYYTGY